MTEHDNDRRIDYIEIPVRDMARTKAFYGRVFGWTFVDYGPDYASFSDGRLSGGFTTQERVRPGGALVIMYATDLEKMRDAVIDAGGAIVKDIFAFPGGRRFHFGDPSGHELAVWSAQ
ncbi:MAG: VOC family protein [Candidatus Eremiobacteraeota bacterium]|nr:VOC family protein [Candidatus Eremiobacteraeota bacterium]